VLKNTAINTQAEAQSAIFPCSAAVSPTDFVILDFVMHVCSQLISSADTQTIISLAFFTLRGLFVSHASHKGVFRCAASTCNLQHSQCVCCSRFFALFPEQVILSISERQKRASIAFSLQMNRILAQKRAFQEMPQFAKHASLAQEWPLEVF
jgi:hypothetical protein